MYILAGSGRLSASHLLYVLTLSSLCLCGRQRFPKRGRLPKRAGQKRDDSPQAADAEGKNDEKYYRKKP